MGKRLGRFITHYRDEFFIPDKRNGQVIYSYLPKPHAEEEIYRRISDISISMKASDHLKMPELVTSEYTVYLNETERSAYDKMKKALVLDLPDGEITAANMDSYERLANAIILQTVKDYRDALKKLAKGRKSSIAEDTKRECERFFRSPWYGALTSVDGEMLIQKLNEEVTEL